MLNPIPKNGDINSSCIILLPSRFSFSASNTARASCCMPSLQNVTTSTHHADHDQLHHPVFQDVKIVDDADSRRDKKNAIFSSRKSDFSRIWSTFRICTHNRMNSKIMPITLAGKENGRSFFDNLRNPANRKDNSYLCYNFQVLISSFDPVSPCQSRQAAYLLSSVPPGKQVFRVFLHYITPFELISKDRIPLR